MSIEQSISQSEISNHKEPTLKGRDIIATHYLSDEEINKILQLALELKINRYSKNYSNIFYNKSLLMLFFNPSVRTRLSFETAVNELGGHAQYMLPSMERFLSHNRFGESIEDVAKVVSRYVSGLGIRIEDFGSYYGAAHKFLLEYAKYATIPVINMADDRFHPCQGLADIMGWAEWFGKGITQPDYERLKGKNFFLTWASGGLHRSKTSPQEALLLASRFGMNIRIAHPSGYSLDPEILGWVKNNCDKQKAKLEFVDNPHEGYENAHIIYSRHWISEAAYQDDGLQKEAEIIKALKMPEWSLTQEKMSRTDNAIFTHPMPVDRGHEVVDEIASGKRSAIYDIAENRLHVQKAIIALTMGNL